MKASFITSVASGALLLLIAAPAEAAVLYSVEDLGTVNGAIRSEARGINNRGMVWGENFNPDFPYFLWFTHTNHGVAKPKEVATMAIYGMNAVGQFAGLFTYSQPARNIAFFGSPNLPTLLVTNFVPRGVNLDAYVAGITSIKVEIYPGGPLALVNRPAIVQGQTMTVLPSLAGANAWLNAEGLAINERGMVVGSSGTTNNRVHAFLWDGTMHDLHTLSTRSNSVAVAINNDGTVVGYMYDFSSTREPFIWTPSNGMTALNLPPGYTTGQPLGLNNRGDVVGVAGSGSAVIWTNGVMTDLQTVIPGSPVWDLDGAYGINDAGEIVGYGKNGGLTKGFLLHPTNAIIPQFTVELLDPGDPAASNALTGLSITTNTAILNSLSARRYGIATDGTSRLLVRISTTNHGTVRLSLRAADGASGVTGYLDQDGGVGNVGGMFSLVLDSYDTETKDTAQGIRAYALYHAPEIFFRFSGTNDPALVQRIINMQAVFTPNSGSPSTQSVAMVIVRPPLVVMHGLWSDRADSFGGFEKEFKSAEAGVQIFGRSYSNAVSFASNASVLREEIAGACFAFREQGLACTRADVFSHSMGGLLSRIYASSTNYKRPENYQQGDINRLVTIDSPHRGTFVADGIDAMFYWLGANDLKPIQILIAAIMTAHKMPPENGAGYDLLTSSTAMVQMNQRSNDVATHVIVGDYTNNFDLTNLPEPFGGFFDLLDGFAGLDLKNVFFSPIPHSDLVVSRESQAAGLDGSSSCTVSNHQHVGAANNAGVLARCKLLYLTVPPHIWWSKGFPTGWTPPLPAPSPPPPPFKPASTNVSNLVLLASGPEVSSGETISVSVSEPAGTTFSSVLLLARGIAVTDTNPPFDFTVTVPLNAVGDYPISYLATDTISNFWWGTQMLHVTFPGAPDYLEAQPRRFIFTRLGSTRQISVAANYGIRVLDFTDPSTGTTYSSADTNVVSVSTNGLMTARGAGETQILISNGSRTAFVDAMVKVLPSPDLALTKTASTTNTVTGTPVVFTLHVTNLGPQIANGVYLTDPLPAGAQFVSGSSSQGDWSFTNGVFAVELGALVPFSNATATVTLTFTNGGVHLNTATVSAIGLDGNDADNEASAVVNVIALPVLKIRLEAAETVVSWLTNVGGYVLEQTPDLTPPVTWTPAATNPPSAGDHYELRLPVSNAPAYFRLRSP